MTDAARKVFEYIVGYKRRHQGNTPNLRQIAQACKISGPSVAFYHLTQLKLLGKVIVTSGRGEPLEIEVPGGEWRYEA